MRWREEASLEQNAAAALPKLERRYRTAGRKAARHGTVWEDLHAFRIATKRFRYTLELLVPVCGDAIEPRLVSVRKIQDVLGRINDCHTVLGMGITDSHPEVEAWLYKRRHELAKEFRRLWREEFEGELNRCDKQA